MKRRIAGTMISGIIAAALLVGCGSSSSLQGNTNTTESSISADAGETDISAAADNSSEADEKTMTAGTTVKIAFSGDKITWQQAVIDQFEKDTGYKVEINLIPSNQDQYSKIMMLMTSPETCPDVIAEDGFMVKTDAAAGRLWALDDALADWEDMNQYLAYAQNSSEFSSDVELDPEGKYVVLSTCAYVFDNARYVLHGMLIPVDSAGGRLKIGQ